MTDSTLSEGLQGPGGARIGGGMGGDKGHEKMSSAPDSSASPKKEATFPRNLGVV